jgi:hypothetical protein
MLQVFVDESESVGDDIYVMAGYVSTAENWMQFISEWAEAKSRVPRIESFKYSECIKQKGQFYGCSEDTSLDKMAELYDIIGKHAVAYVTSAVQPKRYKKVFCGIREPNVVRSSYALLLFTLVTGLMRHMEELGLNGPVDFIFDNQVMEESKVLDAWYILAEAGMFPQSIIKSCPIFRDDKEVTPLQAADMLAGRMLAALRETYDIVPPLSIRSRPTQKSMPGVHYVWREDDLRQFRVRMELSQRTAIKGTFGGAQFISMNVLNWPCFPSPSEPQAVAPRPRGA